MVSDYAYNDALRLMEGISLSVDLVSFRRFLEKLRRVERNARLFDAEIQRRLIIRTAAGSNAAQRFTLCQGHSDLHLYIFQMMVTGAIPTLMADHDKPASALHFISCINHIAGS